MRVYVPATATTLRDLHGTGSLTAPVDAYAITPDLRDGFAGADDEEVEFAVTQAAAEASLELLLATAGTTPGRRVVLVAEADPELVQPDRDAVGAVVVREDLSLRQVEAVLADAADINVQRPAADDLAWFATQEIPDLLAELLA